jgi:hypothetical protein
MTTDNFCFYLLNRLIKTSQTGGQRYSDTSPFSIPCPNLLFIRMSRWRHVTRSRFQLTNGLAFYLKLPLATMKTGNELSPKDNFVKNEALFVQSLNEY